MPVVHVQMIEGRSVEQKRELVAAITREVCRVTNVAPEAVTVIIQDVPRENFAEAGKLFSDR